MPKDHEAEPKTSEKCDLLDMPVHDGSEPVSKVECGDEAGDQFSDPIATSTQKPSEQRMSAHATSASAEHILKT